MTAPGEARRRILIAGASAGIGAALVRALAADGHEVFACARRAEALRAVTERDTVARSRVCDVGDEDQVRALYAWVASTAPALDGLIVAAGAFGAIGAFEQTESEPGGARFAPTCSGSTRSPSTGSRCSSGGSGPGSSASRGAALSARFRATAHMLRPRPRWSG